MKLLTLLALLILLALPLAAHAAPPAQDDAPVITAPPVPDVTPSPLVKSLSWAVLLITTLSAWVAVIVPTIDASKTRIIAWATIWGIKEDWPEFKAITTLLALILAAWQAVTALGYNIFALPNAPALFTNNITAQQVATTVTLVAVAIGTHNVLKWKNQNAALQVALQKALDVIFGDDNEQAPSPSA